MKRSKGLTEVWENAQWYFQKCKYHSYTKKVLDTGTSPDIERNWIEEGKKVCQMLKRNSIEKEKTWNQSCFKIHMPSTMGTSHFLNEDIIVTAKNKYEKSSTKRKIVTQQKIQKIMVNLNLLKWIEQSIGVRPCNW